MGNENKIYAWVIALIAVLTLLAVFGVYYTTGKPARQAVDSKIIQTNQPAPVTPDKLPPPPADAKNPHISTMAEISKTLLDNSKLALPKIDSQINISADKIPLAIQALVNDNPIQLTIQAVNFSNGKKGFVIKYDLNANMQENFRFIESLMIGNAWTEIAGLTTTKATLLEEENSHYKTQILQGIEDVGIEPVHVTFTVLEK